MASPFWYFDPLKNCVVHVLPSQVKVEVGEPTQLVLKSTEVLEVNVGSTAAFVFTLIQAPAGAVHLMFNEESIH